MSANNLILVTGATGQQGGAVARSLLRQGQKVRALTRNPAKAEELRKLGAEVAIGNLSDRVSIDSALCDVKKVSVVTTPFEAGMDAEVQQAINAIDAAVAAGVDHLVYHSVASADKSTGIPHFETKWKVEQYLLKTSLSYTVIRPVFFMENFYSPWFLPSIQQGQLVLPLPGNRTLQMISLRDIGEFIAAALIRKDEFAGRKIDIAGDELNLNEAMSLLSESIGRIIKYEQLSHDQAEGTLGADFAMMFRWFDEVGYSVDITSLEKQWGIPLTKYRNFIFKESVKKHFD